MLFAVRAQAAVNSRPKTGDTVKRIGDRYGALIRFNAPALIWFEILYKLLGAAVFFPLLYGIFDLCMLITGYRYLTLENITSFLLHPMVYIALAFIILLIINYAFFDISAVIYTLHCACYRQKITTLDAARFAVHNHRDMSRKGNRKVLRLVLLMLPVYCVGQIPELLSTYSVPNLFLLAEKARLILFLGIGALYLLLFFPFTRRMYTFHYFTLEGKDHAEAVEKSRQLSEGNGLKDCLLFILFQLGCFLLYMILLYLAVFFTILFSRIPAGFRIVNQIYLSVVKLVMMVFMVIFAEIGTPVSVICTSCLYYHRKRQKGESLVSIEETVRLKNVRVSERGRQFREKYGRKALLIEMLIFLLTIGACILLVFRVHRGEMRRNIEYISTMEVTAHRGASRFYPENTMAAFVGAVEAGADWVELDIHKSRDDQVFVMHDRNFKRTTGVNANAWELAYDEISSLDAGSFFSPVYEGERIPLLSDVIRYAKEAGVRLNIELKPSLEEEGLEKLLVDILHEEDFVSRCVVTSQQYDSLRKIKELDEGITTVYVMAFAYGNINRLNYADNFSVRYSSITDDLVSRVHNAGGQIYAWTVNGRDAIDLMTEKQVDNIITDNVVLARRCLNTRITSDALNDYIQFLNREIRRFSYRFRLS